MKLDRENIYRQMRELIKVSCVDEYISSSEKTGEFHTAFLKFFFEAIDVKIDYTNKILKVKNCKPLTSNALNLYNVNESVVAEIHYSDLEDTLDGCLERGKFQEKYYEMLLMNYGEIYDGSKASHYS